MTIQEQIQELLESAVFSFDELITGMVWTNACTTPSHLIFYRQYLKTEKVIREKAGQVGPTSFASQGNEDAFLHTLSALLKQKGISHSSTL